MFKTIFRVTALLALFAFPTLAQTVNPKITVTGQNGAGCTVGQQCTARGVNWRESYLDYEHPYKPVYVWAISDTGARVECYVADFFDHNRLIFYPPIQAKRFEFKSRAYHYITPEPEPGSQPPVTDFSPVILAKGRYFYARPTQASGSFNGELIFPKGVGVMSINFEAGGTGAQSNDWTCVMEEPTLDYEDGQYAVELEAKSYPASSAAPTDTIVAFVPRPPASGIYNIWIYKFAANGTLVKSGKVPLYIILQN